MRKFGNLVNTNEDLELNTDAPIEGGADAPETDLLNLEEGEDENKELVRGTDAAIEVEEDLNDKLNAAEVTVADGGEGMEPAVLEAVAEGLRVSMNTIGMRFNSGTKPTVESIRTSRKTKRQATLEFIDTVKDKAKQAWDWIVKAFNDLKKWFKEFFEGLFDATKKFKLRAEKIRKQAEQAVKDGKNTKTSEEDDKVSTSVFFEKLRAGGKIDHKTTAKLVTNHFKGVSNKLTDVAAKVKAFGETTINLVEAAEKASAGFAEKAKNMAFASRDLVGASFASYKGANIDIPENCEGFSFDLSLGDKAVYAVVPKKDVIEAVKAEDGAPAGDQKIKTSFDDLAAAMGRVKLLIGKGSNYSNSATQDKVYGLPVDHIVEVSKAVEEHMGKYAGYAKEAKGFEDQAGKLATKCGTLFKKVEGDNGKTMRDQARFCGKACHAMIGMANNFIKTLRSHDVNIAAAALNYCQLSLTKVE